MSFKNAENKVARQSLMTSLFQLMAQKPYADIKISEIASRAGVSRMAYYRNYSTKEDIIHDFWEMLYESFKEQITSETLSDGDATRLFFAYFRKYADPLMVLIQSGLENHIIINYRDHLNELFSEVYVYAHKNDTIKNYNIEYIWGGLRSVMLAWAKGGMKESDEEMSEIIAELIRKCLL